MASRSKPKPPAPKATTRKAAAPKAGSAKHAPAGAQGSGPDAAAPNSISEWVDRALDGSLDIGSLMALAEKFTAAGRVNDVIAIYQTWLAKTAAPNKYVIHFNLAVLLAQHNRFDEAENTYRAAIFAKPDFAQAWFNFGALVERRGRKEHALTIWQSMLDHPLCTADKNRDMYLLTLNSMGRVYEELRQYDKAEAKLYQSLECDPKQEKVIHHWVHLRQKQCKWPTYPDLPFLSKGDMLIGTSALALLSAVDDPGLQLAAGLRFVKERVNLNQPALAPKSGYKHDRIRVGFLSGDFCLHAVSLLTVELYELLDRSKFEVYGFSWSREDGSELRQRVVNAMNHYIRVDQMSDLEAAQLIRSHEIDVIFDLQGLTSGARPNILAARPAPVAISYLGFPGTSGMPFIDYIIADEYLIPDSEKAYYSETPIYLPLFQCSDSKRPVGRTPTRAECGLPEDKFVFCCFNNNHKFTEEMFSCWMRILQKAPNSILWLLADNPWSKANMLAKAKEYGVEDQLIFAGRVAPPDYLARYQVADLFLDAYPFNGGTTVNDALFMGLPVLTLSGRTFASRMGGSLLKNEGLRELITSSRDEYERRAIDLALTTKPGAYKPMAQRNGDWARHRSEAFIADISQKIEAIARK